MNKAKKKHVIIAKCEEYPNTSHTLLIQAINQELAKRGINAETNKPTERQATGI